MDDYEVIYLDDDDERNSSRDHRTQSSGYSTSSGYTRPGTRPRPSGTIMVPPSRRPTIIRHHAVGGGSVDRRPAQVVVHQPVTRGVLGALTAGELVEIAAQVLAAIQPLPGSPVAQGHTETDVENLVLYQTALATHAKRDEQLRTLGGLIGRLLK
jgi:hypothetical protein